MAKRTYVRKASGKRVPFDSKKVEATCMKAGANKKQARHVVKKVRNQIYQDITTREIYKLVLRALASHDMDKIIQHRYRLKESIMLMGPAGFPFETYIAQVLRHYNYTIEGTGIHKDGKCITHEIDIAAKQKNYRILVECKYHNHPGIYAGLKESLYTHARFLDLKKIFQKEMLVCNTKISKDAFTYAKCTGQEILCWKHPESKGLEQMIEEKGLYPITMFKLKSSELNSFSENKIMLVKNLLDEDLNSLAKRLHISYTKLKRLQNIAKRLIPNTGQ